MVNNYSDFLKFNSDKINEGGINRPGILYWNRSLKQIYDKDWTEISTTRYSGVKYMINFKAGDGQYDYYSVIVEDKNGKDFYYLENSDPTVFLEKFKKEFWKNASEYVKNFKYEPRVLGDLEHVKNSDIYNL
jgi:hypothetical protein